MGSDFKPGVEEYLEGVIPRALRKIFSRTVNLKEFSVEAQFLEIYKEKIFDLLDPETKVIYWFLYNFTVGVNTF